MFFFYCNRPILQIMCHLIAQNFQILFSLSLHFRVIIFHNSQKCIIKPKSNKGFGLIGLIIYIIYRMKYHIFTVVLVVLSSLAILNFNDTTVTPAKTFMKWKSQFAKHYQTNEELYRYNIFLETLMEVQQHNKKAAAGEQSYKLGLNAFSDLTNKQFRQFYLAKQAPSPINFACDSNTPPVKEVPDAFDWSGKDGVTAVRDMGKCVGGYAIAAAQSVEYNHFMTTKQNQQFSAQQIIDCSKDFGNNGCKAGSVLNSFSYLMKSGISLQSKYPYKGIDQTCTYETKLKYWEVLGCTKVASGKQAAIKAATYYNPLAVSINAGTSKMKSYSEGIFESGFLSSCKTDPNHWMLLVGYGKISSKGFWKLKNSWGSSWGQQGYLYIVRKGDGEGQCGVQQQLYYSK